MADNVFKQGDVVRDGPGPWMRVEVVLPNGMVRCSWFTKNRERQVEDFPAANLELKPEPEEVDEQYVGPGPADEDGAGFE